MSDFAWIATHEKVEERESQEYSRSSYREVLGDVFLDETNISGVSGASAVLVNFVLVASALGGGGGLLGLELGSVGLS